MQPDVLTDHAQLGPARMTELLRDAGQLQTGEIVSVTCTKDGITQGQVAEVWRALLTYDSFASGPRPASVVLKLSRPDLHPELLQAGRHEAQFYAAMRGTDAPIPRIYETVIADDDRTHIIMADLTATHLGARPPIPPSAAHCDAIAVALGELHAHWWDSPRLGADLGTSLTKEVAVATDQRLYASYPKFADFLGDALLPAHRTLFERILPSGFLERLAERVIAQQNVSLVHGDVHGGNIMLLKHPGDGVALIDWHRWAIDLATFDLAFLMALHWNRDRRALYERRIVQLYHQTLLARGVTGYSFDDCWDDYRREVIICMLIPIGQHRRGSPAGIIWHGLQDAIAAVVDLNCVELL